VPKGYQYELWDGKNCRGYYYSHFLLRGNYLVVPLYSEYKRPYKYQGIKDLKVPISFRVVLDDGINYHIKTVLDVRRKSERQIKLLGGSHA
jgi:hypothetical protein